MKENVLPLPMIAVVLFIGIISVALVSAIA
jgi:hypothetical protein